jgi:hypothetical protein
MTMVYAQVTQTGVPELSEARRDSGERRPIRDALIALSDRGR